MTTSKRDKMTKNILAALTVAFAMVILAGCGATKSNSSSAGSGDDVGDDVLAGNATTKALTNSLSDSLNGISASPALTKYTTEGEASSDEFQQGQENPWSWGRGYAFFCG